MKNCPFCAEEIQDEAIKCRFCGEWLDETRRHGDALEPESFDLILTEVGRLKIQAIKLVHDYTRRGLKEAKDLVDSAPSVVLAGVAREEAEGLQARFEAIGAIVQVVAADETRAASPSSNPPPRDIMGRARFSAVSQDGRCPNCGGTSFKAKRKASTKLFLGATTGVGALLAPKAMVKCETCGTEFRRG